MIETLFTLAQNRTRHTLPNLDRVPVFVGNEPVMFVSCELNRLRADCGTGATNIWTAEHISGDVLGTNELGIVPKFGVCESIDVPCFLCKVASRVGKLR